MIQFKKVKIYIKTTPSSMGYLTQVDMRCNQCRQSAQKFNNPRFVPVCQSGNPCKLATYISERLPNVSYKISDNNVPEITVQTHSLEEIETAQKVVNRAIKLHTHQIYRNCK
ncbi:MAG: hypothetical protein E7009_03940 [Alphaproteobacteria bacterium]|nr:hypothetical protein [Alphaproteobacteria bacterium]